MWPRRGNADTMRCEQPTHPTSAAEQAQRSRLAQLSPREHEILALLSEGLTGRAIARRLFLSPETVRTHVRNATTKLGAKTRVQAVAMLVRERAVARGRRSCTALAPGVGEQLHQQPVVPRAVGGSLVLPHDADAHEPDRLVAADRPLVGGRRVDRQAMVAAVLDQMAHEHADGLAAEAASLPGLAEEEVDAGAAVLRVGRPPRTGSRPPPPRPRRSRAGRRRSGDSKSSGCGSPHHSPHAGLRADRGERRHVPWLHFSQAQSRPLQRRRHRHLARRYTAAAVRARPSAVASGTSIKRGSSRASMQVS